MRHPSSDKRVFQPFLTLTSFKSGGVVPPLIVKGFPYSLKKIKDGTEVAGSSFSAEAAPPPRGRKPPP